MAKSVVTYSAHTPCWGSPPIFRTDDDAVQWAIGQGAFADATAAGLALAELRAKYADGVWALWLGVVGRRLAGRNNPQPAYDISWYRNASRR